MIASPSSKSSLGLYILALFALSYHLRALSTGDRYGNHGLLGASFLRLLGLSLWETTLSHRLTSPIGTGHILSCLSQCRPIPYKCKVGPPVVDGQ